MSNQSQMKKQNPLFSAAVTGGMEDLGSGIVLAAAEKPVFTIGTAPVINDLDNFSEVSLDRDGNSEVGGPFYSNPLAELDSYANLQNFNDAPTLDLDVNSNAQQQQLYDQDVNTNPIAALGSAASMVFSTFSSIMKGSASQARFEENQNQPLPPPPIPSSMGENPILNSNPYGLPQSSSSDPNAPPPTFFTPGDENLFKKSEIEQPSNTFRLGSNKKKTYAHIPGLSSAQHFQNVPQNFTLNPVIPPMPPQPITHVDSMANFQPPAPINPYQNQPQQNYQEVTPEKPISNKFSFSSLLDKIPVTKTLFGSSNDDNNYQQPQYGYEDFSVTSQNYFQPQQSNENQPPINFFNQQQQQQNYSFPSAQQSSVSDVKHAMSSPPPSSSSSTAAENIMPVNFFNPQQFNTTPFVAKVQSPEKKADNFEQIQPANVQLTHVPLSSIPGPFIGIQQPVVMKVPNLPPQTFSPVLSLNAETPKIEAPQPVQALPSVTSQNPTQESIQPPPPPTNVFVAAQTFSTLPPPSMNTTDSAPISFFNPTETSELFKSRHGDDGKPKNPYSNNRARGVGLYKPRSSLTSESTSTQVILPSAPVSSNISTPMNTQQFFTTQPTELPPSSTQSIDEQKPSTPVIPVECTQTIANLIPSQPFSDSLVAQKKSDLNVPENENVEQFQVQLNASVVSETSDVSNFFDSKTPSTKDPEQSSAINFFQAPEAIQSVANFPPPQPLDSAVKMNSINFFSMTGTDRNEIENYSQFKQQEQKQLELKTEEFSSPSVASSTMQTSTLMNDTALMNDITDKMETLSACSRSTLSLFATSELDSTAALKHTSNLQSLIPKYLETQQQEQEKGEQPEVMNERAASVSPGVQNKSYRPVYCHWFYQNLYWHPFSMTDSMAIEAGIVNGEELICTTGGRNEVNIKERRRSSIYWPSGSNAIRKCSWFYMDTLNEKRNLIPYEENIAECLEKEYEKALKYSRWNHQIYLPELLPHQDFIIFQDATTIEHHTMGQTLMVKRGLDEFDIVDGEEGTADHLILCISSFGDKIDDNADEIRSKCLEIIQQYYSEAFDSGQISRIEVLPIALNSIDVLKMFELNERLENVSKSSTDVGRHLMRTMLYSNENFYQKIMNHLAFSLNDIVSKFRKRNPTFGGEISLISASYEALFLFDLLLANQQSDACDFWKLNFTIGKFFACGMPISLLTIRNGERLKHGFELGVCKKIFNILHPFDPIGQRIEPLIMPEYASQPPENIENLSSSLSERIDFILPEDSILETFTTSAYFTSEILMRSLTNEIYGANKMDSGSL